MGTVLSFFKRQHTPKTRSKPTTAFDLFQNLAYYTTKVEKKQGVFEKNLIFFCIFLKFFCLSEETPESIQKFVRKTAVQINPGSGYIRTFLQSFYLVGRDTELRRLWNQNNSVL